MKTVSNEKDFCNRLDFVFVFVLSAFSGIGLHIAGHGNNHELWHNWAVFHVLGSFLFLITVIFHITTHRGWYKGAVRNGLGKKVN